MALARALPGSATVTPKFPLSVHSSGRYLCSPDGRPFLIHGDSPWTMEAQLTRSQVDAYLADRQARGFTAILFELIEHKFSSQSPAYQNANGDNPFASMTDFSTPSESYWQHVDYIINQALARGMLCCVFPAYLGFNGGTEGWTSDINADTTGHLQTYGAFLASRYRQPNLLWLPFGGDYDGGGSTLRARQANIVTGMRSVRTDFLMAGHSARSQDAYAIWGPGGDNLTGWNVNTIYCQKDGSDVYSLAATAYGRSGYPFFLIEGGYEGESGADYRKCAYGAMLSGACGHFFGNNPVWGFGEPNNNGGAGAASVIANNLNSTGAQQMVHLGRLLRMFPWPMVPKTDTSLVSSSLGSGTSRVMPALASDGSAALIYVPSSQTVTVVMSNFARASVRARLYSLTAGTFADVAGTPFSNSGTQDIASGGEVVIALDC